MTGRRKVLKPGRRALFQVTSARYEKWCSRCRRKIAVGEDYSHGRHNAPICRDCEPWEERLAPPSPEYLEVMEAAIDAVAQKEGVP